MHFFFLIQILAMPLRQHWAGSSLSLGFWYPLLASFLGAIFISSATVWTRYLAALYTCRIRDTPGYM